MTCSEAVNSVLLLASLPSLSTPHYLSPAIIAATTAARSRLCIILYSTLFNSYAATTRLSHTRQWDDVQRLLTYVYVQATKITQELDKILMNVDVLLKGIDETLPANLGSEWDMIYRVAGDSSAADLPATLLDLPQRFISTDTASPPSDPPSPPDDDQLATEDSTPSLLPVVAVGGTFDHLHAGHKILLSMTAWIASEKVIVGVTDSSLLGSKSNASVLESLSTRQDNVRAFVTLFKPSLVYDIVPITDVYGPTGWDPNIQGLVASRETLSGAQMIASHRLAHKLPPLRTFIIDVISHSSASLDEDDLEMMRRTKMSSTFIREWIVQQQKKDDDKKKGEQNVGGQIKHLERDDVGWIGPQDA